MKILNITDFGLLKIFLSKYYIESDFSYLFTEPKCLFVKKNIEEFVPDIFVVQNEYSDADSFNVVQFIRKYSNNRIFIFTLQNKEIVFEDMQSKYEIFENITIVSKDNILQKIAQLNKELFPIKNKITSVFEILFVDDSKTMHSFVTKVLQNSKYKIIEAFSAEEALDLYNEHLPNMIITDIEMGGMNGLEFCKKIKENNVDRFIPVIILSSRNTPIDFETAFNYGADDYLTKPVKEQSLLNKIEEYENVLKQKQTNRILVIDEDKLSREFIYHTLVKNGLNVLTSNSFETALNICKTKEPDIIVFPSEINGKQGVDFVEQIKNDFVLKEPFFILTMNEYKKSYIKRYEFLGITRYFIKPFDSEKLVIAVEQLLVEKYHNFKKEYNFMLFSMKSLIKALEARDEYTRGHSERVSKYSVLLGKFLGLDNNALETLEIAASLHDIGKIGIRDEILFKPGRLTNEEYAKIQEHTVIGAEILKPIPSLKKIIPYILYHHEKWNGTGYPSTISGEKIPYGARIIAVADTFDAITSDRPYRKGMNVSKAMKIINDGIGTQFCPEIAKAFLKMLKDNDYKNDIYSLLKIV